MTKIFVLTSLLILFFSFASECSSLEEKFKQAIVRIETPDGKVGTGFILSDTSLGFFLVTNKHVIKPFKGNNCYDSIYIRKNIVLENSNVEATKELSTVYLKYNGTNIYQLLPDTNIDLTVIQLGNLIFKDTTFFNPSNYNEMIYGFRMSAVANREQMKEIPVRSGTPIQIIGFSYNYLQAPQFHTSRFGNISMFPGTDLTLIVKEKEGNDMLLRKQTAEWMLLDVSSRPGDSGGPVFAFLPNNIPVLIAFIAAGTSLNELCHSYPSYYIWDLVEQVRKIISEK